MPCIYRAKLTLALLAVTTAVALELTPVQAQPPQQAHPGKEATGVAGSQVHPTKRRCEPNTLDGERQAQQPPADSLSRKAPTIMAENNCRNTTPPDNAQTEIN